MSDFVPSASAGFPPPFAVPVVTPTEMAEIDQATITEMSAEMSASDPNPLETLIQRAGEAVATTARQMLGGVYGKRVLVIAGSGNNGNDGRAAARRLRRWGAQTVLWEAGARLPAALQSAISQQSAPQPATSLSAIPKSWAKIDLIIDAACGTGLSRPYKLPDILNALPATSWTAIHDSHDSPASSVPASIPTLAVDIPSGVDGQTGEVPGEALKANRTVTFAALKPGLLFGRGKQLSGLVEVADIGLDTSRATAYQLATASLGRMLPLRSQDAHKWQSACWIIGGSPGMTGAVTLAATAAFRSGAGYVRTSTPAGPATPTEASPPASGSGTRPGASADSPLEAVSVSLPEAGWDEVILQDAPTRFKSLVLGPGLNPSHTTAPHTTAVGNLFAKAPLPMVIDGGALTALGQIAPAPPATRAATTHTPTTILTPHDREFQYLTGHPPDPDRLQSARQLAKVANAVVLLKGTTTVVAHPNGNAILVSAGDERLATAGTGDVLSGIIGALLAQGLEPFWAAAAGAQLHGLAAKLSPRGSPCFKATDLLDQIPVAWTAALSASKIKQPSYTKQPSRRNNSATHNATH